MSLMTVFASALLASNLAAQATPDVTPKRVPLDVTAERVEVLDPDGIAVYTGNVNALRGPARLRADRVEVYFQPSNNGGMGEVTRIVARGDVFYVTAEEVARGDEGEYDIASDTIVLTGDVVLTQGCNVSTGHRLTARVEAGYSQLEGNDRRAGRVRTIFYNNESEDGAAAPRPQNPESCDQPVVPGGEPPAFDDAPASEG